MRGKEGSRNSSGSKESRLPSISSRLKQEDIARLEKARALLLEIKERYGLASEDIKTLLEEELSFPAEILSKELTVLESAVKYLKEERALSLSRIAAILGRDQRNVWHIYNNAAEKHPERFSVEKPKLLIPVSILADERLAATEAIVAYLKDELALTYHEIAVLLKRDDRTIWTVYQRARRKNAKQR